MAFRFRKFQVYQLAKQLHTEIYYLTCEFSRNTYYIVDQIRRSSLSIVLNIAEGSSKQSDKDFNRYISIALGSVDETIACLEVCLELKIISQREFDELEIKYDALSRQLGGFSKKLKAKKL